MKIPFKKFGFVLTLASVSLVAQAQVKFKLTRTDDATYTVSMVAQQTVPDRLAITGTMQVSMKIKASEGFELGGITSLLPSVEWDKGTLIKSPEGARDFDYLSIALQSMATRGLAYKADEEVALFSFHNVGNPVSSIQLLENDSDPLVKSITNRFNVQNHISVLGFGQKNAYTGNLADDSPTSLKIGLRRLFPNPANNQVTVQWSNFINGFEGEVELAIVDAGTGRVQTRHKAYMNAGNNETSIPVAQLPEGHYLIQLEKGGRQVGQGLKLLIAR